MFNFKNKKFMKNFDLENIVDLGHDGEAIAMSEDDFNKVKFLSAVGGDRNLPGDEINFFEDYFNNPKYRPMIEHRTINGNQVDVVVIPVIRVRDGKPSLKWISRNVFRAINFEGIPQNQVSEELRQISNFKDELAYFANKVITVGAMKPYTIFEYENGRIKVSDGKPCFKVRFTNDMSFVK